MKININLNKNFIACVNRLEKKYGEKFLKLNGFSNDNLNFSDFIDRFTQDNNKLVDTVINPTANMSLKDNVAMIKNMNEPHQKLLAFNKIYYEITKKYGRDAANEWLEKIWNGTLYFHDAPSSSFFPYCWATSLKPVAEKGLYFIDQFKTRPAQHLTVFCDHVLETVSYLSNRQAGAVGLPDLLVYMYYFWWKDVQNGHFIKSADYYARQCIQKVIYDMNQPYLRIVESAFTNVSIMDREYLVGLFGGNDFPDGTPIMDHIEGIIEFEKMFIEEIHRTRDEHTFTFPVLSYALLYQDGKFVDEDFARWCSDANVYWMDSNFFVGNSITSLSSCCRLINDTSKLSAFINSIGGTALQVGSVKVSTINLRRLSLESYGDEDEFISLLHKYAKINLIGLDRQRHIIKRNIEKGLLPNYTSGLVELEKQYSTIGVTAMYEVMEDFGYITTDMFGNRFYSAKADAFACRILDELNKIKDEWAATVNYSVNIEAVPGESCNIKLAAEDHLLYPEAKDYYIYGNQWIPLREQCTLAEKIRLGALLDIKCGGGQISHINIDGHFANNEQAWEMLNHIAQKGVIYFAFNSKIKECKNGHHWVADDHCPNCGEKASEEYTRIVGFLRPCSSFSKERKREYDERTWFPSESVVEIENKINKVSNEN